MSQHLQDTLFAVVDVETTGLDPATDRVVEIGCALASLEHGVLGSWSSLVDPGRSIPPEASAIHHLVDADVAGAPSLEGILSTLQATEFGAFAAHNAAFDFGFLGAQSRPVLCTHRLARKLWPDLPQAGNQYLRYALRLDVPKLKGVAAHRAEADALVTAHLLLCELETALEQGRVPAEDMTLEGLVGWVNEPMLMRTVRCGKYRGQPWAEVPKSYLSWLQTNVPDLDSDSRHTVAHYLGVAP